MSAGMRLARIAMSALALLVLLAWLVPDAARAYGTTQCAGDRFGSDLNCTANDVQITQMQALSPPSSCTGGGTITLDLLLTINFGIPSRYDVGVFLSNDGRNPQLTVANGGANSCSVAILPLTSPFLNLDSNGGTDTCGDGNGTIGGGTGSGQLTMANVTVACQALNNTGQLYVPFVVSWDNQASPTGLTCKTIADPVPNTKSKCNAPAEALTPTVIVLPAITKTDGVSYLTPGESTTYAITISNMTGITLSALDGNAATFRDPAVANLTATAVSCSANGGATCPVAPTVLAMQTGLVIPSMPSGSTVTFTVPATLSTSAAAGSVITNVATVTSNGQTNSASDSDTVAVPAITAVKAAIAYSDPLNGTTNPKRIPGGFVTYSIVSTNSGQGFADNDNTIVLDAVPANTELFVGNVGGAGSGPVAFTNGTPSSGLTYTFTSLASTTDDLSFSNNGGATFTYTPVPNANGVDPNVTHIRINPKGIFARDTVPGPPSPNFTVSFRVRIK